MWAWTVEACLGLPASELEEGITSGEGALWWPLKMTSDPLKRLRGRLGGEEELQIDPPPQADYKWCTSSRNSGLSLTGTKTHLWGLVGCLHDDNVDPLIRKSIGRGLEVAPRKPSIHLTLFDGPLVRVGSSYAATFSHVATTTCVGVNLASGNPRCTSWVSRWANEWMTEGKGGDDKKRKDGKYNEVN